MKQANEFNTYLSRIPVSEYNGIRKRIIEECGISEVQFRHWRAGRTKVPYLAKQKINEIAGKLVFLTF